MALKTLSLVTFLVALSLFAAVSALMPETAAGRAAHERHARMVAFARGLASAPPAVPSRAWMRWDMAAFHEVNDRWDNRAFDRVMPAVTNLGLGGWQAAILLALFGWAAWKRRKDWQATALLGVAGVILGLMAPILKMIVPRDRPPTVIPLDVVLLVHPLYHGSFPSGHTLTSFTIATIIARRHPWTAPWAFGIAALIGLSRISVGVHWPGDVLASAVLGIATGWLVTLWWDRRTRRQAALFAARVPA